MCYITTLFECCHSKGKANEETDFFKKALLEINENLFPRLHCIREYDKN